ncbi:MAG: BsuPI-related putative proteinase inhibitor [Eubacteriales bacterium]
MKKNVLALIIAAVMLLATPVMAAGNGDNKIIKKDGQSTAGYDDINDCWCKESVEKFDYTDIFSIKDGKFYPDKKITRMEFVRMLHKALGININYFAATDIKDYFEDVENEDVGAGNLIDLVTTGIIDKRGIFGPDKQLDRDEMIHYIINALKYMTNGEYSLIKMMPPSFDDDDKIKPEYKNDVIEAVLLKLIYGRGNNMLFPDQGATRAESAAVIARLADLLKTLKPDVEVLTTAAADDDGLKMSIVIKNISDKAVTINHNSGRRYDFIISDTNGDILYQWSANKKFTSALTTTTINAGKSIEFTDELDNETYKNIIKNIAEIRAYIDGTSESFVINADGYEMFIN